MRYAGWFYWFFHVLNVEFRASDGSLPNMRKNTPIGDPVFGPFPKNKTKRAATARLETRTKESYNNASVCHVMTNAQRKRNSS